MPKLVQLPTVPCRGFIGSPHCAAVHAHRRQSVTTRVRNRRAFHGPAHRCGGAGRLHTSSWSREKRRRCGRQQGRGGRPPHPPRRLRHVPAEMRDGPLRQLASLHRATQRAPPRRVQREAQRPSSSGAATFPAANGRGAEAPAMAVFEPRARPAQRNVGFPPGSVRGAGVAASQHATAPSCSSCSHAWSSDGLVGLVCSMLV